MAQYDAVFGMDQETLNGLIATFYGNARGLFDRNYANIGDFSNVEVDIQAPPTVSLRPMDRYRDEAHQLASPHVSGPELEAAIEQLTSGLMTVNCSQVLVKLTSQGQTQNVQCSAACNAAVSVQPAGSQQLLVMVLSDGVINVPNNPALGSQLTQQAAPAVLGFMNWMLSNLRIPMISVFNVNFSTAVVATESAAGHNYLVAYTGLSPVSPPNPGTSWPAGQAFVGVDAAAINAVINQMLPNPNGSGGTSSPNLSWDYSIGLNNANVTVNPGQGSLMSINVNVGGSASITYHTPNSLPNVGFGASVGGSVTANCILEASTSGPNQNVIAVINSISNVNLSIGINGLPGWLNWIVGEVTGALASALSPVISNALAGRQFPVYTIQPIPFNFIGFSLELLLSQAQLTQISGAAGEALATAVAQPRFVPASQVPLTTSVKTGKPQRQVARAKAAAHH